MKDLSAGLKFCKDCEHHEYKEGDPSDRFDQNRHLCNFGIDPAGLFNLVTGERIFVKRPDCVEERKDGGSCGPDGKNFSRAVGQGLLPRA